MSYYGKVREALLVLPKVTHSQQDIRPPGCAAGRSQSEDRRRWVVRQTLKAKGQVRSSLVGLHPQVDHLPALGPRAWCLTKSQLFYL